PGQILTSVLVFVAFGLSVIALSAALTIISMQNTAKYPQSEQALGFAELGVEEAMLRLIRDPAYAGGALLIEDASIFLEISGDAETKTITSNASYSGFNKKVQVQVSLANHKLTLLSWKQVL
ncbi:hypothetical protein KJ605_00875, partial [Patescibacteria group bacterium]|nr:hypothetical protein [Patescibacteria group bacterium]